MSSSRRGHANLLCIVPSLMDDQRRLSQCLTVCSRLHCQPRSQFGPIGCFRTAARQELDAPPEAPTRSARCPSAHPDISETRSAAPGLGVGKEVGVPWLLHLLRERLGHDLFKDCLLPSPRPLTHSLTHSLTHPPTHSLTHSLTRSLTHAVSPHR